jgi:D-alanyl-D-alanine carboxypeptidase
MKRQLKLTIGAFIVLVFGVLLGAVAATSQNGPAYSKSPDNSASTSQANKTHATETGPATTTKTATTSPQTHDTFPNEVTATTSQPSQKTDPETAKENNQTDETEPDKNQATAPITYSSVNLAAESAIVYNTETETVLYSKSPEKEQPLASLTKLMTALVAKEQNSDFYNRNVTISDQHLAAWGEYQMSQGQTWKLSDLVNFMLVESANDAARAVAAASSENPETGFSDAFIEAMNQTAEDIGLETMYFFNPSGLDVDDNLVSGGYGKVKDVAELVTYILNNHPTLLTATARASSVIRPLNGTNITAHNTNSSLSQYSDVLASKTGYTKQAGGNLVMAFSDFKAPIVIAVLGSTKSGRFPDVQKLYQASKHAQ